MFDIYSYLGKEIHNLGRKCFTRDISEEPTPNTKAVISFYLGMDSERFLHFEEFILEENLMIKRSWERFRKRYDYSYSPCLRENPGNLFSKDKFNEGILSCLEKGFLPSVEFSNKKGLDFLNILVALLISKECIKKRKGKIRDSLNRCDDFYILERIAALLNC